MRRFAAKFVPSLPNDNRKHSRIFACNDQAKEDRNVLSQFSLFPKMKIGLNEVRSKDIAEIQVESLAVLDQHLETGVALGPVHKPQMGTALKETMFFLMARQPLGA
jgi:hypothetical protein